MNGVATNTGTHTRRNILLVGGAVLFGLIGLDLVLRHDDARIITPPGETIDAAAVHKNLRIMDVLAGIPGASAPERGNDIDGKVMWTSTFHLAGGEPGSIKMRIDPADLSLASITLTPRPNDATSSARAAAMARHFLENVAPEFNGVAWFNASLATLAEHPEQTPSTRTDRANFTLQKIPHDSGDEITVEFRLNR